MQTTTMTITNAQSARQAAINDLIYTGYLSLARLRLAGLLDDVNRRTSSCGSDEIVLNTVLCGASIDGRRQRRLLSRKSLRETGTPDDRNLSDRKNTRRCYVQ